MNQHLAQLQATSLMAKLLRDQMNSRIEEVQDECQALNEFSAEIAEYRRVSETI